MAPLQGSEAKNLDHFCLRLEPFDEQGIRDRLLRHGVEVGPAESRYGAEGEGLSIYVAYPDEKVVELQGPARWANEALGATAVGGS